jgi:hypothetical protein
MDFYCDALMYFHSGVDSDGIAAKLRGPATFFES